MLSGAITAYPASALSASALHERILRAVQPARPIILTERNFAHNVLMGQHSRTLSSAGNSRSPCRYAVCASFGLSDADGILTPPCRQPTASLLVRAMPPAPRDFQPCEPPPGFRLLLFCAAPSKLRHCRPLLLAFSGIGQQVGLKTPPRLFSDVQFFPTWCFPATPPPISEKVQLP